MNPPTPAGEHEQEFAQKKLERIPLNRANAVDLSVMRDNATEGKDHHQSVFRLPENVKFIIKTLTKYTFGRISA